MSLTECNSGTTQNLTFGVSTTIELKNVRTTLDNTGTLLSRNITHYMPLLSDIAVTLLSWIVVLTANRQFLDCTTVAFSKRYVPPKRPYPRMSRVINNTTMGIFTSTKSLKPHKCLTTTTIRNKTKAQCCSSLPAQAASTYTGKLTKNGTLSVWCMLQTAGTSSLLASIKKKQDSFVWGKTVGR
jgi:hypothetical protein